MESDDHPVLQEWTWLANFCTALKSASALVTRSNFPPEFEVQNMDSKDLEEDINPYDNSEWTLAMDEDVMSWAAHKPEVVPTFLFFSPLHYISPPPLNLPLPKPPSFFPLFSFGSNLQFAKMMDLFFLTIAASSYLFHFQIFKNETNYDYASVISECSADTYQKTKSIETMMEMYPCLTSLEQSRI